MICIVKANSQILPQERLYFNVLISASSPLPFRLIAHGVFHVICLASCCAWCVLEKVCAEAASVPRTGCAHWQPLSGLLTQLGPPSPEVNKEDFSSCDWNVVPSKLLGTTWVSSKDLGASQAPLPQPLESELLTS